MAQVIDQLAAEQLLAGDDLQSAIAYVEDRPVQQPWYIRTMVGFGAWLASLLLIGFVSSFTFAMEGGYAFVGIVFIVAAVIARYRFDNDFMVQSVLALSLAGQALVAFGFVETIGKEEPENFCIFVVVMSSVLFFVMPDRIHRVIMVLLAAGCATALLYFVNLNDLVPALGPLLAFALIVLHISQGRLIAAGYGEYVKPLLNGLMLAAFGLLLISTIYVLPELSGGDTRIYPRPWVSTILLGALLLWVGARTWSRIGNTGSRQNSAMLIALILTITASCYAAPGILLALIVIILGADSGDRNFAAVGTGFLIIFLATYFYGIEVTMLTKSISLVATGVVLLLARWLLLTLIDRDARGEESDA